MKYGPPLFLGILALVVHFCIYGSGLSVASGDLHDPDAYMRLVRAGELVKTGDWFNQTIERDNAPEGLEMHWSRPVDILLISLAAPAAPFLGWEDSLFLAGVALSPLLLIPALLFLDRLARKFFDFEGRLLAMLFFLCQPGILNYFVAGRPDHHSLILLMVVAVWTWGAFALQTQPPRWQFALLGWLCALGHWISIEFLVAYAVVSGAFALNWVFRPESGDNSTRFQANHLIGCCVFLIAETPQGVIGNWWLDRLSGFHCLVFLAITLAWWLMVTLDPPNPIKRVAVGLASITIATIIIFLSFPEMAKGPFGQVDPELKKVWLNHVQELHPLGNDFGSVFTGILSWLPAMLPGLAWIAYSLRNPQDRKAWITPLGLSWLLATMGITWLSFIQKRWICYADLLWIVPAVFGLRKWLEFCETLPYFRAIRAFTLVLVCAGPVVLANWIDAKPFHDPTELPPSAQPSEKSLPDVISFSDALESLSRPSGQEAVIFLNFIDMGPEILYTSPHATLSSPYHRNHQGILDAHTVLASPYGQETAAILNRRRVDYVLVSATETEKSFYGNHPDSLHYRLIKNQPPSGFLLIQRGRRTDGTIVYFYRYESEPSFHLE